MYSILLMILIIISFLLIVFILLQSGKGGGLASAFGGAGGTDTVFGGRAAATFLGKATAVLGVAFMLGQAILPLTARQTPTSAVVEELQSQQQSQPLPSSSTPGVTESNPPLGTGESTTQGASQVAPGVDDASPAQPESVGVN